MVTHSSILAWKIPWTEEPGGLKSMGSQTLGHYLATKQQQQQQKLNEIINLFHWYFSSNNPGLY